MAATIAFWLGDEICYAVFRRQRPSRTAKQGAQGMALLQARRRRKQDADETNAALRVFEAKEHAYDT